MSGRILLKTLPNTRDLGGMPVLGGVLRGRRLLRSGCLFGAGDEDLRILCEEYDLRTIVDFRAPMEIREKPDPDLPGVEYVPLPVLNEATLGITREESGGQRQSIQEMICAPGFDPIAYMSGTYRAIMEEENALLQYRKFLAVVLHQEEGAVLWHCSAGKDRAGVGTAFLLMALGAENEDIMADYLLTNRFVQGDIARKTCEYGFTDPEICEKLRIVFGVNRPYLQSVFDAIRETYGTRERFLEEVLGVSEKEREILRKKYTE